MKYALAFALATLWATNAQAGLVLDQNYLVSDQVSGGFSRGNGSFRRAQVVTAGASGLLGAIDIQTDATSFGSFNILAVNNGLPTTTVLGTASFVSSQNGYAQFTSSVLVNQGQQFALEPVDGSGGNWRGDGSSGYTGGDAAFLNPRAGIPNFQADTSDFGFRTYVDSELTAAAARLDQAFVESNGTSGIFSTGDGSFRRAQVVTAGASGLLGAIDIQTDATSFGSFNILAVNNGLPTTTVLGTASFDASQNGYARFTSSVLVNEGQQFALEPIGSEGSWFGGNANDYAGGDAAVFNTRAGDRSFRATTSDFSFRTYVSALSPAAAVPEPATWAMMIFGMGGIGFSMRHRKANVRTSVSLA